MSKSKYLCLLLMALLTLSFTACSDDDKVTEPTYSSITISPDKEVYHVGDVITCSITRKSTGSDDLKEATYWWYASWWFSDPNLKADFQEFDEQSECTSSQITLSHAGEVKLYFFGRLEYPNFDWRKVEIARTITVIE